MGLCVLEIVWSELPLVITPQNHQTGQSAHLLQRLIDKSSKHLIYRNLRL